MNALYKAIELIKNRLEENELVNTIIFARQEEKDLYHKNIFPIAHIIPLPVNFNSNNTNVSTFGFEVGVFEQRDINPNQAESKFEGNDNVIDNLNLTYSIIQDLMGYLLSQNNNISLEVVAVGQMTPITFNDFNILDGYVISFEVQVPNDINFC